MRNIELEKIANKEITKEGCLMHRCKENVKFLKYIPIFSFILPVTKR